MDEFEKLIGYKFKNKLLLQEALTHPSVKKLAKNNFSYQRLEFLGDKVLGLIIAEDLINRFKNENEGQLSQRLASVVCKNSLALIAQKIQLGDFIIFGKSQIFDGGKENYNILENTMEALIGAIFLDSNLNNAKIFILKHFNFLLKNINSAPPIKDSKSEFQEWFQKKYKSLPEYNLINQSNFLFEVELKFNNLTFNGKAKSIKEAQKLAAYSALKHLNLI
jgi:ribonuclease III